MLAEYPGRVIRFANRRVSITFTGDSQMRIFIQLWIVALAVFSTHVLAEGKISPLFASDDVMSMTLAAPFAQMVKQRKKDEEYDTARLTYTDEQGDTVTLPVTVSLGGNSRLDYGTCAFPPLKLQFDKKDRKGTYFEHTKKIKLVTQCRPRLNSSRDDLLSEYQAYRMLNTLTDQSYRVRLLEVTYVDQKKGKSKQNFAFLIEPTKHLAKRVGLKKLEVSSIPPSQLLGQEMNLVSLYQLLVGNTDWSASRGGSEECCHNGKLFSSAPEAAALYVPYDLDMTGFVEPSYAIPSEKMNLASVRDRRYRGYCQNNEYIAENISGFNEHRDEIVQLVSTDIGLSNRQVKNNLKYINSFYRLINDEDRLTKHVERFCLGRKANQAELVASVAAQR